jgi:beta-glucosidase
VRLDQSAFSFYDPDKKGWVAEKGSYKIIVGASSRDINLSGNTKLAETAFAKD